MGHLPKAPWNVPNAAKLHERLGDVHAKMGHKEAALTDYAEAARLYPTSKQPWGRVNLPKHVNRVRGKMARLRRGEIELKDLRDGQYTGTGIGYARDVAVTLVIQHGRVAHVHVKHKEHIEQYATRLIPAAIERTQSLKVDAITAATVTSDAIIEASYRAACKAGLKP